MTRSELEAIERWLSKGFGLRGVDGAKLLAEVRRLQAEVVRLSGPQKPLKEMEWYLDPDGDP